MNKKEIPPRLRWQCRRGMLELDVLLGNFLEKVYVALSDDEKNIFEKLLACSDQDLFMWLTGKSVCEDKELFLMVEKIRDHAKHSHKT